MPSIPRHQHAGSSRVLAALLPLLLLVGRPLAADTAPDVLTADQIMARAIEYSKHETEQLDRLNVTYSKTTVTELLDHAGDIKKTDTESIDVEFKSNKVRVKLLDENDPSAHASTGAPRRREEKPLHLTPEIIAKFHFVLVERQSLNQRQTYLLAFAPRPGQAENSLADRFLNQLAGWVWIDSNDFAVTRARIKLIAPVNLWGGLLGSLKDFNYDVERAPVHDGLWFNLSSRASFEMRKLFVSKKYRTRSDWKKVRLHELPSPHM